MQPGSMIDHARRACVADMMSAVHAHLNVYVYVNRPPEQNKMLNELNPVGFLLVSRHWYYLDLPWIMKIAEGAVHTSEVAVNCRSASPWAAGAAVPAAAGARSSKVHGMRYLGILNARGGSEALVS